MDDDREDSSDDDEEAGAREEELVILVIMGATVLCGVTVLAAVTLLVIHSIKSRSVPRVGLVSCLTLIGQHLDTQSSDWLTPYVLLL